MADLSKRRTLFGLIAAAGAVSSPRMAEAFDLLRADDFTLPPTHPPALFASRERLIGNPMALFPKLSGKRPKGRKAALADSLEFLDGLDTYGIKGQIAGINSYINGVGNIKDISRQFKSMHWAAPISYFKSGEGSEDYAIAKYVFLRKLGFHPGRLRVVWVEDGKTKTHHAVLAAILDNKTFILENRFAEIASDRMLPHYHPYCSANETGFSLHWDPKKRGGIMASLDRLGRRPKPTEA